MAAVPVDTWPALRVAVTGSLASGKSTVAGLLAQMDLPVIDCDFLARKVTCRGSPGLDALVKAMGRKLLAADNTLNRQLMLDIILHDPDAKSRLEEIVHPLVFQEMSRQFEELASSGHVAVIAEVPLLFEAGWQHLFQFTVMVTAPENLRLERIMARNNISREMARRWMFLQMDQGAKEIMADFIIKNDKDMVHLEQQTIKLWKKIKVMESALHNVRQ